MLIPVCGRSQIESGKFRHAGISDLNVYRVEENILKEICSVPLGWADVPRNMANFPQCGNHGSSFTAMKNVSTALECL
jgi:hypothetical protein